MQTQSIISNNKLISQTKKYLSILDKYKNFNQKDIEDREIIINELENEFGAQKSRIILHARVTAAKYSDPVIQYSLLNTMEDIPFLAESLSFEINFYQMMFGASQQLEPYESYEVSTNKHGIPISPYNRVDYNMNEKKFTNFYMKILFEYNNNKSNEKEESYEDIYFNILTSPYGDIYTNILNNYKENKTDDSAKFIKLLKDVNLSR